MDDRRRFTGDAPVLPPKPAGRHGLAPFSEVLRQSFPSREALLAEARAQTHRRRASRKAGTALAIAALVATVWWVDPAWRTEEVRTQVGERGAWTLRDGSELTLNTASVLKIESRLRSRRFVLEEGEAAFQVTHGWRPFVVRAGTTVVRDIGTVFTMRRMGEGTRVSVLEGAVEVREAAHEARTLIGGEAIFAPDHAAGRLDDAGAVAPVEQVDVEAAGAWRKGRLVFEGLPLAEAVREFQRYRVAPIALADERVGRLRISGAYDTGDVEAMIDTIGQVLPVTVARAADGSVRIAARK